MLPVQWSSNGVEMQAHSTDSRYFWAYLLWLVYVWAIMVSLSCWPTHYSWSEECCYITQILQCRWFFVVSHHETCVARKTVNSLCQFHLGTPDSGEQLVQSRFHPCLWAANVACSKDIFLILYLEICDLLQTSLSVLLFMIRILLHFCFSGRDRSVAGRENKPKIRLLWWLVWVDSRHTLMRWR